jgi:hypothetical protein
MKLFEIWGENGNGVSARCNVTEKTFIKIESAKKNGAKIIISANWRFKGKDFSRVEKLCQTNNRKSGKPKHIVWACYK